MTQTQHSAEGFNVERGTLSELSHDVGGTRYVGAAGRLLDDALRISCDSELLALVNDVETLLPHCSPGALIGLRRRMYSLLGPLTDPNGPDVPAGVDGPSWPPQLVTAPDQVPDPPRQSEAARADVEHDEHDGGPDTQRLDAAVSGSRRRARRASDQGG